MNETPLYQGNSIFRNQPSYTIFNKSFEEAKDILFLQLDEIEPHFLTQAQLQDEIGFTQKVLIDPRTKKAQTEIEYDCRRTKQKPFMVGGIKSSLTKEEQKSCLRLMIAQQEQKEILEADLVNWRMLQTKLLKERDQMQKFINQYAETHKEEIYTPTKRLDELYKNWFEVQKDLCLKMEPNNLTFNTHTGLPHVSTYTASNMENVDIVDIKILAKQGMVRIFQDDYDWQNFNIRIPSYAETYNEHTMLNDKNPFMQQINEEFDNIDDDCNGGSFYIPIETLLFLLTAGEYVDLPTEVLLEIRSSSYDDSKIILFDIPLPAQNCGWHTQQKVVEQCFAAFMSIQGRAKWFNFENDNIYEDYHTSNEMNAGGTNFGGYKPLKTEEFFAQNEVLYKNNASKAVKLNNALFKSYLKNDNSEKCLKLLTTFELPPVLDKKAEQFLGCEFIKLENKPQFGAELMTKYELLRAWLHIKFMSSNKSVDYGFCYRLSTSNFKLQLKERLTLESIEQNLQQIYHVNISQLLFKLNEFLKLLCNMQPGKYMLRYNFKYKEKLLLCAPSQEITQNTIFLHNLLEMTPTNLTFMTQRNFLPISDKLCSAVHLDNEILPCAFLPLLPGQKRRQTAESKFRKQHKFIAKNESKNILSKEKILQTKKKALKRIKRKKKKKLMNASKVNEEEINVNF